MNDISVLNHSDHLMCTSFVSVCAQLIVYILSTFVVIKRTYKNALQERDSDVEAS